ncbi:O-antigen ligase family protein [Aliinostoc sp. HNIBRCY26]|uniref:O-antigen ligase family protein n=1 Tax=Aliinostoc sp. HNIBRCY26 TaxID=3418997 RepID=UPI003D081995
MKKVGCLEKCFVILALTFFSGAIGVQISLGVALIPSSIQTIIRYSIFLISFIIIYLHRKKYLRIVYSDRLFWVFTVIVFMSFLWSEIPTETLKDNRDVLYMTAFGLYFAARFSLKEQVKLIANTFFIGALLSTIYALAIPSIGIHGLDHPGAWKGIYDYKNTFGSMMVIGSLAFLFLPISTSVDRLYKWIGISFLFVMILLCTSKSSLVIYFLTISILAFYRKFRWRGKISVVFLDIGIMFLSCVGTLVISQWVTLLTGLGKDPTLTGRTILWNSALLKLLSKPILGFGRSAFWSTQLSYGHEVGAAVGAGFVAPHAHNGFLDVALDVGFVGAVIFLIIYFRAFFRALKLAYATKKPEAMFPMAFIIFLAMNNMTESYMLRLANVYWVLFITTNFSLFKRDT